MHPIRDILIESGYKLMDVGAYWRTSALYRGGTNGTALSIDKKTGFFQDFATGACGSAEKLAKIISGKDAKFDYVSTEPEVTKIKVTKTYPKDILRRLLPEYDLFLNRGISKETLDLFEAGKATAGKLNNRICFPIYSRDNKIIGFAGRWFKENKYDEIPKWKLLGGKKTDWLYPNHLNLDIIRKSREIIICEAVGECLALWEAGLKNSLVIFGTSISSKQLSYIVGLDPDRVIIATNNDEDPAKGPLAAKKIRKKLTYLMSEDKVTIALPTRNDFGDMSVREIQDWYSNI